MGKSASAPYNKARFPPVSLYDNVHLQHWLVTGWLMGAMQTFQWGTLLPDMDERILPFMGSARCSRPSQVFLAGLKADLTADGAFQDGWCDAPPKQEMSAFDHVYAGGELSQTLHRLELDIRALVAIRARAIVMPASTDLSFPPADIAVIEEALKRLLAS